MYIERAVDLHKLVCKGKVVLILGPRQVGKTTLVERFMESLPPDRKVLYVSGEDWDVYEYLSQNSLSKLRQFIGDNEILIVDEAHKVPNIGFSFKLIVDMIKDVSVIATGSSSFGLLGQVGEPLVGRKRTVKLYPVSVMELIPYLGGRFELMRSLDEILIYGMYPEVIVSKDVKRKREILEEIVNSYLLKDVFEIEGLKRSHILVDMLKMLALQVGNEVSLSEIGAVVGLNKKTVARYLSILEEAFILYRLPPYSRNLRNAITKKSKYYFYDVGVRNAIIRNFNPLSFRDDIGRLWENFLVIERLKKQSYKGIYSNNYFWRSYSGGEVDWVEERDGKLLGYEFKYSAKRVKVPKHWAEVSNAEFEVITRENFLDFVS